jgi:hypothetical protein
MTFGINYVRRFKDTDLFETIFYRILKEAIEQGLVEFEVIFIDSTHVKAHANKKKWIKKKVRSEARHYQAQLMEEINADRISRVNKPLALKTTEKKQGSEGKYNGS